MGDIVKVQQHGKKIVAVGICTEVSAVEHQ